MKPENVKYLLDCYLRERFNSVSCDAVDGKCSTGYEEGYITEMSSLYPESPVVTLLNNEELDPENAALARQFGRQLSQMSDEFEHNLTACRSFQNQPAAIGSSFVQFKQRCLFVSSNCGKIEICIVRTGNGKNKTGKVAWETVNKTAKSGVHYIANGGEIIFTEGEVEKIVEVETIRNQCDKNISFCVKLLNPEGIEIGCDNPLTIYITDHSHLANAERQVIENIVSLHPNSSVSAVAVCLHDKITPDTFQAAVQYTCSYANAVPQELALAFELVKVTLTKAHIGTLYNSISDFFSELPELKDLVEDFN